MKLLKNICIGVAIGGFILAYGTAGTSDLEMETGCILMTSTQFYMRMIISGLMLVCGSIGVKICNIMAVCKHRRKALKSAYRKYNNQQNNIA